MTGCHPERLKIYPHPKTEVYTFMNLLSLTSIIKGVIHRG